MHIYCALIVVVFKGLHIIIIIIIISIQLKQFSDGGEGV